MIRNCMRNQIGSVGIMAVLIMAFLGLLGGAFVKISTTELNTAAHYRDGVAAEYLAEAGVKHAIAALTSNNTYIGTLTPNQAKNSGATAGLYSTKVEGTGNTRTITSTGKVLASGASRQLKFVVSLQPGEDGTTMVTITSCKNK